MRAGGGRRQAHEDVSELTSAPSRVERRVAARPSAVMRGVRKTGDVSCIAWRWRGLIMFSAHRSQVRCELRRSAARNQDMYILYATNSRSTGSRTQPSYATQIPRTSGSGGGAPRFTGAASLLRVGSLRRATRDSNRSTREAARAQWECMAGASQLDLTAESVAGCARPAR